MKNVNGRTRLLGLIGNPIEHTLSPFIHNYLSEKLSINEVYVPFLVEQERLKEAVRGAYALNVFGMNVTIPYKNQVIEYLKEIDVLAKEIGAVNTLVRIKDGYKGYNTDALGLLRAMESQGIAIQGEEAIVIGAGGGAKAVVSLLLKEGIKGIYLCNRHKEGAQKLAKDGVIPMGFDEIKKIPYKKYLAVQTTPVGMFPKEGRAPVEDEEFYKKIHTGIDLIYRPFSTKFMEMVKEGGGKAFNGLKMLLYQGVIAYELWNDRKVPEDIIYLLYEELKRELNISE